jgi:hypothetical protein
MLLLLLRRATRFEDFGLGCWQRLGERCPRIATSVLHCCNCHRDCRRRRRDNFKIGNADFDLAAGPGYEISISLASR